MKKFAPFVLLLAGTLQLAACTDEAPDAPSVPSGTDTLFAEATLVQFNTIDKPVRGRAVFWTTDSVTVNLKLNLEHDWLGGRFMAIHIHEGGTENPGMHFNAGLPMNAKACNTLSMGAPWGKPYIGDVGNLETDDQGAGEFEISTDLWSIHDPELANSILNRSIIVHMLFHNFAEECDPEHVPDHEHSNPKYALGEIKLIETSN